VKWNDALLFQAINDIKIKSNPAQAKQKNLACEQEKDHKSAQVVQET